MHSQFPALRLARVVAWIGLWIAFSDSSPAQSGSQRFGRPRPQATPPQPAPVQTVPDQPALPRSFATQVEQAARQPAKNLKTTIELTILTPAFGAALPAQRWAKVLSTLGVDAQFRSATGGDETGVEQVVRGPLRSVRIVGRLTADGNLDLVERVYTPDDERLLREWLDELKTYGAQGSPRGQPLWGLSQDQFNSIYESLNRVVEAEVEGLPLTEAIAKLPLPAAHPLRNNAAADAWLAEHPASVVANRLQGLSCGTVLSVVLSEAGLGFRPQRTPDGRLELTIEPRSSGGQFWPIGWELPEDVDHGTLVPMLHKFSDIGFTDAALQDVLDAAAAVLEVPILIDYHAVRGTGVDLAAKSVSYPIKRTTWALMLNTVIRKVNLIKSVRVDEQGRAFLFIEPFVPTPVERAP